MVEEHGQRTLLIVDESPIFRQALAQLLKQKGVFTDVVETGSVSEAESDISTQDFTMVIIDLALLYRDAGIVRSVKSLKKGESVTAVLPDGEASLMVSEVRPKQS